MSDIVHARHLLRLARQHIIGTYPKQLVSRALKLMVREAPKLIVNGDVKKPLTKRQRKLALLLRYNHHWSLRRIAIRLRTNQGRISEAVNPERKRRLAPYRRYT